MLVDGKKKSFLMFVEETIPSLYKEVKNKIRNIVPTSSFSTEECEKKKRKRINRPSVMVECENCPKELYSFRALTNHMLREHTESTKREEKKNKTNNVFSSPPNKSEVAEDTQPFTFSFVDSSISTTGGNTQ